jgi:Kef-type K+ transport system membrane component KefB
MPEAGYLGEVIVLLAAAVVAVAFAYHLRLGPIMGYLVAGIAVGPHGLGLIRDLESTRALAEFGVVFLLFTIGLELPPSGSSCPYRASGSPSAPPFCSACRRCWSPR